jgi:hypothetical protein
MEKNGFDPFPDWAGGFVINAVKWTKMDLDQLPDLVGGFVVIHCLKRWTQGRRKF